MTPWYRLVLVALSGLFAPGPKKHTESLEEWREKQDSTDRRDRSGDEP